MGLPHEPEEQVVNYKESTYAYPVDTAEALKKAIQAVKDAELPETLWSTAFPLAFADIRGKPKSTGARSKPAHEKSSYPETAPSTPQRTDESNSAAQNDGAPSILTTAASTPNFLEKVADHTGARLDDLNKVFTTAKGTLSLEVKVDRLGKTRKDKVMTVTALIGGAIFAGTDAKRIPRYQIYAVCNAMGFHDSHHAAGNVRETRCFEHSGSRSSAVLMRGNGWKQVFLKAIDHVLIGTDNGPR